VHTFEEHAAGRRTLGDFARLYAEMGYRVFPLARGSKRPMGGGSGVLEATSNPWDIISLWGRTPHANIGLATGDGLVVLDFDVKGGANGMEEFGKFLLGPPPAPEAGLLALKEAPLSSTPSGGMHAWLAGSATGRTGLLPGLDVKSDGGYVVAPPSGLVMPRLEEGQAGTERIVPYLWETGCPCTLPAAPDWTEKWTANAPGTGTTGMQGVTSEVPEAEALKKTGLAVGSRNEVSSRLAASLFRKWGTSAEGYRKVTEEMREIWEATDKSGGFTWSEVLTVIRHAHRYIKRREEEDTAVERSVLGYLRQRENG